MQIILKNIHKILVWCASFVFALGLIAEGWHHHKYEHFVSYGLHADVILGNSQVGTNDTYFAVLKNLSITSYQIEGCRLPGGIVGSGILFAWDVQRFNSSRRAWDSLSGANNWVPQSFASERLEGCRGEMARLPPFSSRSTAWILKNWVTDGGTVRMAIHTSVHTPTDQQSFIYMPSFTVEQ